MNARELEAMVATLGRRRRRSLHALVVAAVVAAVALALAFVSTRAALALAAGAAAEVLIAGGLWLSRRELIERLALDPDAYAIPDVARFGARIAAPRERERIAALLQSVVKEPERPQSFHLRHRARIYARELEAVARELAAPATSVEPPVAVACRRLLTRPVQSPLYNPNLADEDLAALLLRIRAGMAAPARSGVGATDER
jgi:hypothetical protein